MSAWSTALCDKSPPGPAGTSSCQCGGARSSAERRRIWESRKDFLRVKRVVGSVMVVDGLRCMRVACNWQGKFWGDALWGVSAKVG